jgi:Fe-S-cluster containining protein
MPDLYRPLLNTADDWFARVLKKHPDKMQCRRGCFDCCLGLFDISIADASLLAEGLALLDSAVRRGIEDRARAVMKKLPDLGASLEDLDDDAIDALSDSVGPERCVCLGDDGACLVYEHRPLVCRLNGAPIVDSSGQTVHAEGCFKNSVTTRDVPKIDYAAIEKEERKVLKKLFKAGFTGVDGAYATFFIPQAVLRKS